MSEQDRNPSPPPNIGRIKDEIPPDGGSDQQAELEEQYFALPAKKDDSLAKARVQQYVKNEELARKQRASYANRVYWLIVCWIIGIFSLIMFAGTGWFFRCSPFHLSDTVILAMIGGTTINVLGLFVIVMRHLFPDGSKIQTNESKD